MNPNDIPASEIGEQVASTPPTMSNARSMLPPQSGTRRNRSESWNHFTTEPGPEKKAMCNYCKVLIRYDNGTSGMRSHLARCKKAPEEEVSKRQKSCSSRFDQEDIISSPSITKFDQEAVRRAMVDYFVDCELPFRHVEKPSFRKFMSVACPKYVVPSRTTVARDVLKLLDSEKSRLKQFISQQGLRRLCLTTDTWSSPQKLCYMSLTLHFVDNSWRLNKKIISFCPVTSHAGDVLARKVERCLNEWGINRVLGVTVDNASSNDVMLQHLKKRFTSWSCLVLNGDYLHMRCAAHILNLIVKQGFMEIDNSIFRIRSAVKFINDTPKRYANFKACIDPNMEYKGFVGLDCETRWNSTYIMLDAALKHQKTFEELELQDSKFGEELQKKKGVPSYEDWDYVRSIVPYLKVFYEATLKLSGSSYVTSCCYMYEVFGIRTVITQMSLSSDARISSMAGRMRAKYDRYWGDLNNLNMLLMIALVLDPRHKMRFVNWYMNLNIEPDVGNIFIRKVESSLESLFADFSGGTGSTSTSADSQSHGGNQANLYNFHIFYQTSGSDNSESELGKYLREANEPNKDMDVLNWWSMNSSRYPILSEMAREVLAIPVSTVASESAFSTGGRVLDPYRCRLTPTTVEALVCTQDWFGSHTPMITEDDLKELEHLEQGMNHLIYSILLVFDLIIGI